MRLSLAMVLAVVVGCAAQTAPSAAAPAFAVASVRPVSATTGRVQRGWRFDPGRFSATGATLQQLVTVAYSLRPDQITGGEDWSRTDLFAVTAVCSGACPVATLHPMLQTLLAQRFGLQLKREQRQGRVYVLAVAKGGAKLATYKEDGSIPPMPSGASPEVHVVKYAFITYKSGSRQESFKLRARQATPAELADYLAGEVQAPVQDQTGISAAYNFGLVYAPVRLPSANAHVEPGAPSLPVALQEQLGLTLTSHRGTLTTFKILSVHPPTAN